MNQVNTIETQNTNKNNLNTAMLILQVVGIVAVVMGHIDIGGEKLPNILNLAFPYYSWHMPFFIFVSGYFFNRTQKWGGYILKKVKTHLLPALAVNAVCGLFSMTLKRLDLTDFGQDITLDALFVKPFTTGYQFFIDVSLWFIFSLFLIEVVACTMDRLVRGKGDLIYLVITLAVALYCSYRCFYDPQGTKEEFLNMGLRQGYLMFFFWLGACYKRYAEGFCKKIFNYKTSIAIFAVQAIYLGMTGYKITTNVRNMVIKSITVPDGYWVSIVAPITATIFFLGLAYQLAPYLGESKLLATIGRNTKYIVYYHQLIFTLFAVGLGALITAGYIDIPGFDFARMRASNYYTCGNLALTAVIGIIAFAVPLIIGVFLKKQKLPIKIAGYALLTGLVMLILYLSSLAYA